jgi:hypothetical protein
VSRRLLLWALLFGVLGTRWCRCWTPGATTRSAWSPSRATFSAIGEFVAPPLAQERVDLRPEDQVETQLQAFARLPDVSAVALERPASRLRAAGPPGRGGAAQPATGASWTTAGAQSGHAEPGQRPAGGTRADARPGLAALFAGNALVMLLSALGSVAIYQLVVTRRLLAIAQQLRGVTAQPARPAGAPGHAGAAARR